MKSLMERLNEAVILQMFPAEGAVNKVFNDFANFINTRKFLDEPTEKKFVAKLQSLSGMTNSPLSLLQKRIEDRDIDYSNNINQIVGRGIIDEMKDAILRHSK